MTKRLLLISLVVVSGASSVWADALRPNTQKARGGILSGTASQVVSGSAELVTGVAWSCGSGGACTIGLYDANATSNATVANGFFEGGSATSVSNYVSFKDAPIRTTTGVTAVLGANTSGMVVFTEQNIP